MAGKLVDYFSKYKAVIAIALLIYLITISCLAITSYFRVTAVVFLFNGLFGIFLCILPVTLINVFLQHTHPKPPGFVIFVFMSVYQILINLLGIMGRLIFDNTNAIVVFIYYGILFILAFVINIFLNPTNKRKEAMQLNDDEDSVLLKE